MEESADKEMESSSEQSFRPAFKCYATGAKLYKQIPWTHVEKRMPIAAEYPTPGPNAMPLPSYIGTQVLNSAIVHRPAWSLHQRIERKSNYYPAGPSSYFIRNLKAQGGKVSAPAFTMRTKQTILSTQELPGPASYEAKMHYILPVAPAFSFREKPKETIKFNTPAANEYTLPTILGHHKTPPAHVLGCKTSANALVVTPGPGAYDHKDFRKVLPQSPQFTIGKKLHVKQTEGPPGPGSYCPEKVIVNRTVAPQHSLGIKHSPYVGVSHPRIVGPRHC